MKPCYAMVLAVILGLALVASTASSPLATFFIKASERVAGTPEVVTAIVWDFRGFDTFYETTVFFIAIIGLAALIRQTDLRGVVKDIGTPVARATAKIVLALGFILAVAIALHGHLSPGGGFQAGTTAAIALFAVLGCTGVEGLRRINVSYVRCIAAMTLGLCIIALVALLPLALGGAILQNLAKPWLFFPGYPVKVGAFELGGSLFLLDLGELVVIALGFALASLLMGGEEQ